MKDPLLSSSFKYKQQDPDYKGQQLDQCYGDGPIEKRGCTDVFCCILFGVFIAAMVYVAMIGFNTGNPYLLIRPFDTDGNQCGITPGYESYDKIFISEYIPTIEITFVCVRSCPTTLGDVIDCKTTNKAPDCTKMLTFDTQQIAKYCLPLDQTLSIFNQIKNLLDISFLQKYFADLYVGWPMVLIVFGLSFVISIIYSVLIRFFAGCMMWIMIIAMILLQLGIALVTLLTPQIQFLRDLMNYDSLPQTLKDRTFQIVLSCISFVLFFITFCIACCMRKQIRIAIGIIKASADFVRNCYSAFFLPLFVTILQAGFLLLWLFVILYLFSSNDGTHDNFPGTPFSYILWNDNTRWLIIFQLFSLLWVINFFSGLQSFWVSSTTALWYFEGDDCHLPVLRSICRSIYHIGSIALGSLLLALVQLARIVLEFINNQLKQKSLGLSDGKAVSILIKCGSCLIACFERLVRFLTDSAYVMIAISGKNFCSSAQQAFYLMVRSAGQFTISIATTKIFTLFGTAVIITMCSVSGYLFMTNVQPYKYQVQSPVFLTILFILVSAPVSWAFMQFFEKAANTILMCYCLELDLKKRNPRCPGGMKRFLEEYVQSSSINQMDQ